MQLNQFAYTLPPERIAQNPVEPRDHSRLLVLHRQTGSQEHHHFFDLPQFLKPGDVLVINDTRVLPVRLFGKKPTGGGIELLFLHQESSGDDWTEWEALSRPGLKEGQTVHFAKEDASFSALCVRKNEYTISVRINENNNVFLEKLNKIGEIPTPPYVREFVGDPERFQTVYSARGGSAAAPTAGLHFTAALLDRLKAMGVEIVPVTLHVGLGTFLPVKVENIADHKMHSEWFEVPAETAQKINAAKAEGRRVIAVGTTSVRTLESAVHPGRNHQVLATSGDTNIFITPGFRFQIVDALITNFHLPESTLLMLVSALVSHPQTPEVFTTFAQSMVGKAYQAAMEQEYRFFSFGDAMLIVE